jgi:hypothetical protein
MRNIRNGKIVLSMRLSSHVLGNSVSELLSRAAPLDSSYRGEDEFQEWLLTMLIASLSALARKH